ncbi:glutamate cyclase domain-containing protein [Arsukibacterium ikkense]|nr:glutamate cyclase domain-containing protein [Arsukibacterium ikkense]
MTTPDLLQLSQQIEQLLVARNLRGMQLLQQQLRPGYILRAARLLNQCRGTVLIGTGFPVLDTFETDGPVGAIALYQLLTQLGARPVLVSGNPLCQVLASQYRTYQISVNQQQNLPAVAARALAELQPQLIISIERPGFTAAGRYANMRGEDITGRCASFDYFLSQAACPTIGIGDGGNEIGMGNMAAFLGQLNITPAVTQCDELIVADVSNWAAWGIIAMVSVLQGRNLLTAADPLAILQFLSSHGSVDGVTRLNTLTEDGLAYTEGEQLITDLRELLKTYQK